MMNGRSAEIQDGEGKQSIGLKSAEVVKGEGKLIL